MKLGWRVLLPASLANILVTGVVYLGIAEAGTQVTGALKIAADVTQAVVAAAITLFFVRLVLGFFQSKPKEKWIVGSSAEIAAAAGGSKTTPMQA
jgi:hypothetical protein